jgi:hypothetical protein
MGEETSSMSTMQEPAPVEQIRLGPIRTVKVFTPPVPADRPVAEALGTQSVPFDEIKHLISSKPLERATPTEPAR